MSLKEYHRLADLFSKLNSQENIEDDFTSMPDAEKLKFFWQNCAQEKIDPSSIIEKTQRKMRKDAMKRSFYCCFLFDLHFNYLFFESEWKW